LHRICSDAAEAMAAARPVQGNTYLTFGGVFREWLGNLNEAKQAWEDEKQGKRAQEKTQGTSGPKTMIKFLDETDIEWIISRG
jgi:hypothetical protein